MRGSERTGRREPERSREQLVEVLALYLLVGGTLLVTLEVLAVGLAVLVPQLAARGSAIGTLLAVDAHLARLGVAVAATPLLLRGAETGLALDLADDRERRRRLLQTVRLLATVSVIAIIVLFGWTMSA